MNKFQGKFEGIAESTLGRYQQGGFLAGDYVRIKKDALSHELIKPMSDQMKAMLVAAIKKETVLRLSYIKSGRSESFNGPVDASNIPTEHPWADIIFEYAPGMWKDPMTVPLCVLEKVELESDMAGYAQYSDDIKRDNDLSNDESDEVDQTAGKEASRNLTTKNTKLANTKTPKDGREGTKLNESLRRYKESRTGDAIFETYMDSRPIVEEDDKPISSAEKYCGVCQKHVHATLKDSGETVCNECGAEIKVKVDKSADGEDGSESVTESVLTEKVQTESGKAYQHKFHESDGMFAAYQSHNKMHKKIDL